MGFYELVFFYLLIFHMGKQTLSHLLISFSLLVIFGSCLVLLCSVLLFKINDLLWCLSCPSGTNIRSFLTEPTNKWWFFLLKDAFHSPPLSSFIKGNGSDNHFQTGSILDHQCVSSPQTVALFKPSILIASSTDNYSHRSARNSEQIKAKLDYECNAV